MTLFRKLPLGPARLTRLRLSLLCLLLAPSFPRLHAQTIEPGLSPYSRKNSYGVLLGYSNDSSHIFLGAAENRKLLGFGLTYARRLVIAPSFELQYVAEYRPVLFVSDPVVHQVATLTTPSGTASYSNNFTQTAGCKPATFTSRGEESPGPGTYTLVLKDTCQRQWTFGEGLSPLGMMLDFRPRRPIQPVLTVLAGYLLSTKAVPVAQAGAFNYTFSIGAGLEFFRSRQRSERLFGNSSLRAEYRYNHISNAYTASENPGIDNGVIQITYAFGR